MIRYVSSPDTGGPDLSSIRLTSRFSAVPETNYHGKYTFYIHSPLDPINVAHSPIVLTMKYEWLHFMFDVISLVIGDWKTLLAFDPCVSGDHFVTSNLF